MCRVLEVSRSAYYAWVHREPSGRRQRNVRLLVEMKEIYRQSRRTYGSPRIHRELGARGIGCSVNHVAKLMRENGIRAESPRRFRVTTDSAHSHPVAENVLNRDFSIGEVNQVWVSDITYIGTREGWLYLAVVLDLGNREAVGWSMSNRVTSGLTREALGMAIGRRDPSAGLLHHSDRGSQYAAEDYQRVLGRYGIRCSMSRRGNCWDNAVMESFWATLKKDLVYRSDFRTREEAHRAIFEYMEVFYNRQRRHSALGYVSPAEYAARSGNSATPTASLRFQTGAPAGEGEYDHA